MNQFIINIFHILEENFTKWKIKLRGGTSLSAVFTVWLPPTSVCLFLTLSLYLLKPLIVTTQLVAYRIRFSSHPPSLSLSLSLSLLHPSLCSPFLPIHAVQNQTVWENIKKKKSGTGEREAVEHGLWEEGVSVEQLERPWYCCVCMCVLAICYGVWVLLHFYIQ